MSHCHGCSPRSPSLELSWPCTGMPSGQATSTTPLSAVLHCSSVGTETPQSQKMSPELQVVRQSWSIKRPLKIYPESCHIQATRCSVWHSEVTPLAFTLQLPNCPMPHAPCQAGWRHARTNLWLEPPRDVGSALHCMALHDMSY